MVNFLRRTAMIQYSKNGEPRTPPLNQTALEILRRKLEVRSLNNNFVFISKHGTKIDRHNPRRAFLIQQLGKPELQILCSMIFAIHLLHDWYKKV